MWIVGSTLAREQLRQLLAARLEDGLGPGFRVWCWHDLWRSIGDEFPRRPACLSTVAARAVLAEAISLARAAGVLGEFATLLQWPGFRRRLRSRIAAWIRAERAIEAPAPQGDALLAMQWDVYVRYRRLLRRIDAEDDEGFAVWASRALRDGTPSRFLRINDWTFLDLEDETPAIHRVLAHAHEHANKVQATLPYDPAPELAEVHSVVRPFQRLLIDEMGFEEVIVAPVDDRPAVLTALEHELFRSDAHARLPVPVDCGVAVIGAPQGDGVGLVLAQQLARRRDSGAAPEDILILFRRWDDDAAVVCETIRGCGFPVADAVGTPLANEPAIAALKLAMKLPVEGWETGPLIQLLRHGRVQPDWPEPRDPSALAATASLIQSCRVFRGRDALRQALDRTLVDSRVQPWKRARARQARDVLDRLIAVLEPLERNAFWHEQVPRLRTLARALGLEVPGDAGLDALWIALDDQGAVFLDLGRADELWSWAEFVAEVESLIRDAERSAPPSTPGTIRVATVDEAAGARARHVFLVNLTEGAFPVREAIQDVLDRAPGATDPDAPSVGPALAREMRRFLRVLGSADESLVLAYPTTDAQGQELLKAGFLDELLRRVAPEALPSFHTVDRRIDPALLGCEALARSAADRRVLAVARACTQHDSALLQELARSAAHRAVLEGTAAALRVLHDRTVNRKYGHHDGRLDDPRVIEAIADRFDARYAFSPSQIESYVFCPFQFYMRYVLKLEPINERDELEEDFTERGSRIHRLLELLEQRRAAGDGTTSRLELARELVENDTSGAPLAASAVDAGLELIQQGRLIRTIERYARQHEAYDQKDAAIRPTPHLFEFVFGIEEEDSRSYPPLALGTGSAAVLLQGKIDRIDLVSVPGGSGFRIIDYKSGGCPGKTDVKESLYLQLPLYALAVEQLVLGGDAVLHDVGYWALRNEGFASMRFPAWDEDQGRVASYVQDLVNHIRHGVFPVDPRKDECTKSCEFAHVCRIGQIKTVKKPHDDVLRLELKVK